MELNFYANILEASSDYSKWKKQNVTLRGIKELGKPNNVSGFLGKGLYTVPLSNKAMAKQYGTVYFVVNAIPKNPLVVSGINEAEITIQKLIDKFCKENDPNYEPPFPERSFFEKHTTIEDEMIKMGYDGMIIKGREMVNYKPENILYFKTEQQLEGYFESVFQ